MLEGNRGTKIVNREDKEKLASWNINAINMIESIY